MTKKISELPAASAGSDTDLLPATQGATTGKLTIAQLRTAIGAAAGALIAANNLGDLANPGTARTNLSLGNVTNTSDANKPVSTAQAAADAAVQAAAIQRVNHTGTQLAATISDFIEAAQDVVGALVTAAGGTYNDAAGTITLPTGSGDMILASAQAVSGLKTFASTKLALAGSTSGAGTLNAPAVAAAYVWTLPASDATLAAALPNVDLTGANTLTQALHFNRSLIWTGSSTAAQAISATASKGDFVEITNAGTAIMTVTGASIPAGYRPEVNPGETFQAKYDGTVWTSATMIPPYIVTQNSQSAAYTFVTNDAGKHIFHPVGDNNARAFTIPANASVPYPIGTVISGSNRAAPAGTLAITSDTLTWLPTGATGTRTIAQYGKWVIEKITATEWELTGVGIS